MSTPTFYPLDHLTLVGIEGSDALNFLQGQGTQDYHRLADTGPRPGAFCNAKGRVVSNVWNVLLDADPARVKLVLHASASDGLQRHLGKYIPFFRGSRLVDDHLHYHGLGLTAADSGAVLDEWLGAPHRGVWQRDGHFAFQLPDGRAQLWLDARAGNYEDWLEHVEQQPVRPREEWQRLDLEACYPWVQGDQHEAFLPQTLNLDLLDGVSFRKGCYTGQEVIARLHYKGKAKRRLARLTWNTAEPPAGPQLYTDKGPGGDWVNWQATGDGGIGLAVVKETETPPRLFLDEGRRIELNLLDSARNPERGAPAPEQSGT